MSTRLTTAQILAAARQKRATAATTSSNKLAASATAAVTATPAAEAPTDAELTAYLARKFTADPHAPSTLPHPLSHYLLPCPPSAHLIPDFVSAAEEAQLLALVAESPATSWTQLKRRSLQMWGGHPSSSEAPFAPASLPAWQSQLIDRLVSVGVTAPASMARPNHVLLNRYEAGQGIFAHRDGPLYCPLVSILSLGSHTVMHFYSELKHSLADSHQPAFSVMLPPRSLFVFSELLYTTYFHAIAERTEDEMPMSVLQQPLADPTAAVLPTAPTGPAVSTVPTTVVQRGTRISLTIRRVTHSVSEAQK